MKRYRKLKGKYNASGSQIKKRRKEMKMSQKELAEQMKGAELVIFRTISGKNIQHCCIMILKKGVFTYDKQESQF